MSTKTSNPASRNAVSPERAFNQFDQWARSEKSSGQTANGYRTAARNFSRWVMAMDYHLHEIGGWELGEYENYLRGTQTPDKELALSDFDSGADSPLITDKPESYPKPLKEMDITDSTRHQYLSDLKAFLRYLDNMDVLPEEFADKLEFPDLSESDERADSKIEPDRVLKLLGHLDKYQHASREHVILLLLWQGPRSGAMRSVDLNHVHVEPDRELPYFDLEHRPEYDLSLKNGYKSKREAERGILLPDEDAAVIREYIAINRHDSTDEFGNSPLLTSENGRLSKTTIRTTVYQWTCPAAIGEECSVHDHKPSRRAASKCRNEGGCVRPHDIRGAAITYYRNKGVPIDTVSERMNVSPATIRKHYDDPDKEEELNRQRGALELL